MKRTALVPFVGLMMFVGCSKSELAMSNHNEIAELKKNVLSIQEQLKKLSASLAKAQQSQEELRQQQLKTVNPASQDELSTRLSGVEKQLAESSSQIDAINKTVTNLRMEKLTSPAPAVAPTPVVAAPEKNERTKAFLLAAVDRGYKNAAVSGTLSDEDKLRVLSTANYLRKEINDGKDPRLTTQLMFSGTQEMNRIMTRFFPEFLPE